MPMMTSPTIAMRHVERNMACNCPHSQNNQTLLNAISELIESLPLGSCVLDCANARGCRHSLGEQSLSPDMIMSLLQVREYSRWFVF